MKIYFDGGFVREANPTFEEAEFVYRCMADWDGWNLSRALAHVSKPRIDVTRDFHSILVFCDPWPSGVCGVRYFKGNPSGFQVNFLSMLPESRGEGKGTKFKDALAWFANQYLGCDSGRFQADAPQVQKWAEGLNGELVDGIARLVKDETAKTIKSGYSVTL